LIFTPESNTFEAEKKRGNLSLPPREAPDPGGEEKRGWRENSDSVRRRRGVTSIPGCGSILTNAEITRGTEEPAEITLQKKLVLAPFSPMRGGDTEEEEREG